MTNWRKKIKIKHLFNESEEHKDIQESMNNVADVLQSHSEFSLTNILTKFRNIPVGDEIITPADYANKLLSAIYDIADEQEIWLG
jgi:hypothetical protein